MCRKSNRCSILGGDPSSWSTTSPLPPPAWLSAQLDLFESAVAAAARGEIERSAVLLGNLQSDEMRIWFEEHGQFSGKIRASHFGVTKFVGPVPQLDPLRSPARHEKAVFARDCYICRYCGLRLVSKDVLVLFERVVGSAIFRTHGRNAEQHGIVHAFKIVADHVVPHRDGGSTSLENLVSSCPNCNYGKYWYSINQIGIEDPLLRPSVASHWDGMRSYIDGLRRHVTQ